MRRGSDSQNILIQKKYVLDLDASFDVLPVPSLPGYKAPRDASLRRDTLVPFTEKWRFLMCIRRSQFE